MIAAVLSAFAAMRQIPAWLWAAALLLLVIVAAGYAGYRLEYSATRTTTLENSIKALRQRKVIDEDTRAFSDDELCRRLGGVPDGGECL
jgi:hypothetical protein